MLVVTAEASPPTQSTDSQCFNLVSTYPKCQRPFVEPFMPDRLCGAGYLKRPGTVNDDIVGSGSFGLMCFVRQTIRYEMERAAEEKAVSSIVTLFEPMTA